MFHLSLTHRHHSQLIMSIQSLCLCGADIRVDVALSLAPGLAAQLLFQCVRQAAVSRDEARAKGLCTATLSGIKAALKVKSLNIETEFSNSKVCVASCTRS